MKIRITQFRKMEKNGVQVLSHVFSNVTCMDSVLCVVQLVAQCKSVSGFAAGPELTPSGFLLSGPCP